MLELTASLKINEWCSSNNIFTCDFVCLIGHKENDSVYGALFKTENGLVFQRHKWVEINKSKSVPKVCSEIQYTHKEVTEDIWNSFKQLDNSEYLGREINDEKSIN